MKAATSLDKFRSIISLAKIISQHRRYFSKFTNHKFSQSNKACAGEGDVGQNLKIERV